MSVHSFNDHREAAEQRKADALRCAVKDAALDALRLTRGEHAALTAQDLRDLAAAASAGWDRAEMWAELAAQAGVKPPGSFSGDPRRVVGRVAKGLLADATAAEEDESDPVLIAQLQASLDALRAG